MSDQRESNGAVVWFSGLSASGKSTVAGLVAADLCRRGIRHEVIDGDEVRDFFGGDLGFSRAERMQNIRRIAFAAHLLARHGVLVLVANIAPYEEVRSWIRAKIPVFALVYMDTPLATCRERDHKKVYENSRTPVIGVDDPYDVPRDAELVIANATVAPETAAAQVLEFLRGRQWI